VTHSRIEIVATVHDRREYESRQKNFEDNSH
jgi:hypothetical protein